MKIFPVMAVLALPAAAIAAGPLLISTSVMVEQRVAAGDGTTATRLVAPGRIVPGDKVMLVIAYRNTGAQPLANVVLANPVPKGMAYRAPAGGSPAPEVSVDGNSFGNLATLKVRAINGATRAATLDDVTAVRWRLGTPLAAGAQGKLAFQAVLK